MENNPYITENDHSDFQQTSQSLENDLKYYLKEIHDRIDFIRNDVLGNTQTPNSMRKVYNDQRKSRNLSQSVECQILPEDQEPDKSFITFLDDGTQSNSNKKRVRFQQNRFYRQQTNLFKQTNAFQVQKEQDDQLLRRLRKRDVKLKGPFIIDMLNEVKATNKLYDAYHKVSRKRLNQTQADATLVYTNTCRNEKVPPLPVLAKQHGRKIVLNHYSLQPAYCLSFAQALPKMHNLKEIYLDHNGITDAAGAQLLNGIASNGQIHILYYTNNEIGVKFMDTFQELSQQLSTIKSLNLKGCKTNGSIIANILKSILDLRLLQRLRIAELQITDIGMNNLIRLLNLPRLQFLDIS